jgi:glycosyltransferase involved in cell wall biosynthesis
MDGGSKDGSADIIRARADKLAYWQSERDGGQASAINAGLSRATGDVIGWVNSDDLYTKGALEKVGRYFAEHPDVMLVYGDCLCINEHDRVLGIIKPGPFDPAKLAYRCYLMQMAVFFRRDLLERVGSFDTNFAYALDWDLWLRAGLLFERQIAYLPETLACYRTHAQSQTVRDVLPALLDVVDVQRKLIAVRPQPAWLVPISGDILRAPLIQLLGAATDEATLPTVLARMSKILGADALQPQEWTALSNILTAAHIDNKTREIEQELLSRIERLWIAACGGAAAGGHDTWLAETLVELGWRHLYVRHVGRALLLFSQAISIRPKSIGQILRWRLVEWLVRAYVTQNAFVFLRGIKRKLLGLFQPSMSG